MRPIDALAPNAVRFSYSAAGGRNTARKTRGTGVTPVVPVRSQRPTAAECHRGGGRVMSEHFSTKLWFLIWWPVRPSGVIEFQSLKTEKVLTNFKTKTKSLKQFKKCNKYKKLCE